MINELLKYEQRMNAVGLSIEDAWHPKLKTNAKGAKIFLAVQINPTGTVASIEQKTEESHLALRHYDFKKSNSGLTFKKSQANYDKSVRKVWLGLQNTIDLADMLAFDPKMQPLQDLAACLKNVDPEKLWQCIVKFVPAVEHEHCYISLDGVQESIQTEAFLKKMNKCLFELNSNSNTESTGVFDALGLPNPIKGSFNAKINRHGNVNIYSRNPLNDCYKRYGLNGLDLCSFGTESRNRLSRILNEIIKYSHEFRIIKAKKIVTTLVAVSTLVPEVFEFEGDFTPEEWQTYTENLSQKILNQKRGDTLPGEIIVFRKPSNGPWSIEHKICLTHTELDNLVKEWDKGTQYFATSKKPKGFVHQIPSLFCLTEVLSSKYTKQGDNFRVTRTPLWTLVDSIELFSGSNSAFRKMTNIASAFMVPVFVECAKINGDIKFPWEMRYAFAIFGMILNKENIMLDELENNPMHCLGRLLCEADRIHRRFFTSRDATPPKELIGQRFMKMCYDNPQRALSRFKKHFQKYLNWAIYWQDEQQRINKKYDFNFSLKTFREMETNIGINVPMRPNPVDLIALGCGFAYRKFTEAPTLDEGTQNETA